MSNPHGDIFADPETWTEIPPLDIGPPALDPNQPVPEDPLAEFGDLGLSSEASSEVGSEVSSIAELGPAWDAWPDITSAGGWLVDAGLVEYQTMLGIEVAAEGVGVAMADGIGFVASAAMDPLVAPIILAAMAVSMMIPMIKHYLEFDRIDEDLVLTRYESPNGTCDGRFGITNYGHHQWSKGKCQGLVHGKHLEPWVGTSHTINIGKLLYKRSPNHRDVCRIVAFDNDRCEGHAIGAWDERAAYQCLRTPVDMRGIAIHCKNKDGTYHHDWKFEEEWKHIVHPFKPKHWDCNDLTTSASKPTLQDLLQGRPCHLGP